MRKRKGPLKPLKNFDEKRFLQQFRSHQMSRTLMITLAVATEADAYCRLENKGSYQVYLGSFGAWFR
jgi:hypothetical protein